MPRLRLFLGVFIMSSALLHVRPAQGATHETNQENEGPLPIAGRGRTKQRQNLAGQNITASIGSKSSIGASTFVALPEVVVVPHTG
jgi:hypothetical protein